MEIEDLVIKPNKQKKRKKRNNNRQAAERATEHCGTKTKQSQVSSPPVHADAAAEGGKTEIMIGHDVTGGSRKMPVDAPPSTPVMQCDLPESARLYADIELDLLTANLWTTLNLKKN